MSAMDLQLETILEDQIIVIRNLLTPTLCKKYVSLLSSLPLTPTAIQPRDGEAIRVNDRIQLDDYAFAEQLWASTALESLVRGLVERVDLGKPLPDELRKFWGGVVSGLSPRIRVYRYSEGQFFGQHCE